MNFFSHFSHYYREFSVLLFIYVVSRSLSLSLRMVTDNARSFHKPACLYGFYSPVFPIAILQQNAPYKKKHFKIDI